MCKTSLPFKEQEGANDHTWTKIDDLLAIPHNGEQVKLDNAHGGKVTKLLNLDALLPEPAAVSLRGVEYPVIAKSVEAALLFLKSREKLVTMAETAEQSPARLLETNIEVIAMACPSIKDEIMGLPLPALMKLVEFITEEMGLTSSDEEGEEAGEAEAGSTLPA